MEDRWRWRLVTAIAPVAWGSTYFVTHRYLPPGSPVWGATIRALPAGLLLLAVRRARPVGSWWWRSFVLGSLNTGAFFGLVYVAAQRLPTSVASTIMATSPLVMMATAWLVVAERPRAAAAAGAAAGIVGVVLMLGSGGGLDAVGVAASVTALVITSFGYLLAKRWGSVGGPDVLASTAWQLVAGGFTMLPVALAVEGTPPPIDRAAAAGFAYVIVVATAVAFAAWFTGLRRLRAGEVGLIGLLNPVTGVALGVLAGGERLGVAQVAGAGLVLAGILAGLERSGPRPAVPVVVSPGGLARPRRGRAIRPSCR